MADLKISALTASTTPLAGTEVLPIVQSSTTKKVSVANLTAGRNVAVANLDVQGSGYVERYIKIEANTADPNYNTTIQDRINNGTVIQKVEAGFTTTTLVLQNGNLTLSSAGNFVVGFPGKGIDFSATPGAGTSELLADYEEGTWTVTDASGAGLTLVTATGFYTKIGRVVYWQANVDYPVTANSSNALLGGLPFTISEGASPGRSGSFITATSVVSLVQTLQITPTNIRLYKTGLVRATNAELSGSTIYLAGFYVV